MKKTAILIAAALAFTSPMSLYAADQSGYAREHKSAQRSHQSDVAHEEIVDGVKVTFKVITMKEYMKSMDMKPPKDLKETHHFDLELKDARSGNAMTQGEVKVKVMNPDETDQTKNLQAMQGHFGGDFDLSKKGKYSVICRFLLNEGKVRTARFMYNVK